LWGDHTSGLPWDEATARRLGHGPTEHELYLTNVVPFIVDVAGQALPARVTDVPCGQVDVAPTLLALLGVDPRGFRYAGRNLFGSARDVVVVQRWGVWSDRQRLFLPRGDDAEGGLCYQLPSLRRMRGNLCASGYAEALQQIRVSRDVIEHDLQRTR
jgi:lipoteichoic acid synthase